MCMFVCVRQLTSVVCYGVCVCVSGCAFVCVCLGCIFVCFLCVCVCLDDLCVCALYVYVWVCLYVCVLAFVC